MSGLTDQAGGELPPINKSVEQAHQAWEASMARQLDTLRQALLPHDPAVIAHRAGASFNTQALRLPYWNKTVRLSWPDLQAGDETSGRPCSIFDTSLLLYYLSIADGAPLADRWVSYRELPGGGFYHQAFQGYSGDRLARALNLAARLDGEGMVEVAVADRGCGMTDGQVERLYTPFFTTKAEGMGMGLNICRSIVEYHDGRLWVQPNPGGGSVFRFTLPVGTKP